MAENVDMRSLLKRLPEVGYLAPHRSNCGDVWLMTIYPELLPVSDMVLFIPSSFRGLALLGIAQTTSSVSSLTYTSSYHESSTCP